MKIILLGAPGCGKGTQATKICHEYNVPHISTGDIFRQNMSRETAIGLLAKSYIDKGQLVPDDVTVKMVLERLSQDDCSNGFVLDGFPRTVAQAESLGDFCRVDIVIDIAIAENKLLERITGRRSCNRCGAPYHISRLNGAAVCVECGGELIHREDDKEETVIRRLAVYKEKTMPLIKFYEDLGLMAIIDGDGEEQEVFDRIKKVLDTI